MVSGIVPKSVQKTPLTSFKMPFYALRKNIPSMASKGLIKKIKKCKKALKEIRCRQKVKKSIGGFLGDKTKYNTKEMVLDVNKGLKKNQTEEQFCSLMSLIQNQPITGKAILPLQLSQLHGFRLRYEFKENKPDTPEPSEKKLGFKIPETIPSKKVYNSRGRGRRGRPLKSSR